LTLAAFFFLLQIRIILNLQLQVEIFSPLGWSSYLQPWSACRWW